VIPKVLILTHRDRAGDPPECVGKPCRCPTSPAAPLPPGGSPARSLRAIISETWYNTIDAVIVAKDLYGYAATEAKRFLDELQGR
jgi:hypothetical protein